MATLQPMNKSISNKKELPQKQRDELLAALRARFDANMGRHTGLVRAKVQARLEVRPEKLWSLAEMERTGGEPDVVGQDKKSGEFDTKSSSWLRTPPEIRELGGAIYGDRRYNRVFIGHNGAESYYSGRGFRGSLKV